MARSMADRSRRRRGRRHLAPRSSGRKTPGPAAPASRPRRADSRHGRRSPARAAETTRRRAPAAPPRRRRAGSPARRAGWPARRAAPTRARRTPRHRLPRVQVARRGHRLRPAPVLQVAGRRRAEGARVHAEGDAAARVEVAHAAARGVVDEDRPVPPEPRHWRLDDVERGGDRDGGVEGVAPGAEDLEARVGRERMGARHQPRHAFAGAGRGRRRGGRLGRPGAGEDRERGADRERGEEGAAGGGRRHAGLSPSPRPGSRCRGPARRRRRPKAVRRATRRARFSPRVGAAPRGDERP